MINFDSLPTENPFALPAPGLYKAHILEAVMKQGSDTAKPPYLNVKYALSDAQGVSAGTLFDIISESDSSVVQFKVGRFIRACGLPLTGAMELKDIGKLVVGRDLALDVKITPAPKDSKYNDKAEVDLFSRAAYYLPSEFAEEYQLLHPEENAPKGEMNQPTDTGEEAPFNAPDGGAPVATNPLTY